MVLPTDNPLAPSQRARRPCARGAQRFSRRVRRRARFNLSDFFFDEDWRTNPRGYAASFEFMVTCKHITILKDIIKAIKGTLINTIGDRRRDFKAGANPLIVNEFLKRIYQPYNGPTFCSRNKDTETSLACSCILGRRDGGSTGDLPQTKSRVHFLKTTRHESGT